MQSFIICVHDATPAFAAQTRMIIRDLAPIVGRRFSLAVVPNWHAQWPLADHRDYCRHVTDACEELLLHGYFHRREHGYGPVTMLTAGSDEMNGLDAEATRSIIARGQDVFSDVFGEPARGFLPPAWQRGRLTPETARTVGLRHVMGFFSLQSSSERRIPLATWTWDSSRWRWTGHLGNGIGWLRRSTSAGVPTLAIHPRDIDRGFWPEILGVVRQLLDTGHAATTVRGLLETTEC